MVPMLPCTENGAYATLYLQFQWTRIMQFRLFNNLISYIFLEIINMPIVIRQLILLMSYDMFIKQNTKMVTGKLPPGIL